MKKGVYIAIFYLTNQQTISVGRFGRFIFNRGYYFYVGSAQKNLSVRLERHSRKSKSLHWHIDYLSTMADMMGAIIIPGERTRECEVAHELKKMFELYVPGFGASDCRCAGHLFYSPQFP